MPYCPNCGTEVGPEAKFCPKCGVSMAAAGRPYRAGYDEKHEKSEKGEKREKDEKTEKAEKHEKAEMTLGLQLGVGLIVLVIGFILFVASTRIFPLQTAWPYVVIILGLGIILLAIMSARSASSRNPRP